MTHKDAFFFFFAFEKRKECDQQVWKYNYVVCAAVSPYCVSVTKGRAQLLHTEQVGGQVYDFMLQPLFVTCDKTEQKANKIVYQSTFFGSGVLE